MPTFDAGSVATGNGWGCNCGKGAFRLGTPTPDEAVRALARAATVTVTDLGIDERGVRRFRVWTEPGKEYDVLFGPGRGGYDKHCMAATFIDAPFLYQAALGAGDLLDKVNELEKANRKLRKELERCQKAKTK